MKKLSIIIPVYNCEKYIKRCIDSIGVLPSDAELIIVNDGSTDSTEKILSCYKNNINVTIINKTKTSVGDTRNVGIQHAKGEYIWFVDADDYIIPNAVQELILKLASYKADLWIFGASKTLANHKEKNVGKNEKYYNNIEFYNNFDKIFSEYTFNPVWNKLYKKEIILKHNIKFTDIRPGQDAIFNYNYMHYISNLLVINKIYYDYQMLMDGSSSSVYYKNFLEIELKIIESMNSFFEKTRIKADKFRNENYLQLIIGEYRNIAKKLLPNKLTLKNYLMEYYQNEQLKELVKNYKISSKYKTLLIKSFFIKHPVLMYLYVKKLFSKKFS